MAAAYHVVDSAAPFALMSNLTRAFTSVTPLHEPEIAALTDLISLRLTMSVIVASWRATLYPDNQTYILRYRDDALMRLSRILTDGDATRAEFERDLKRGAGTE